VRNHNVSGAVGIWATANQVRSPVNAREMDALEVWGPVNASDADHYSYIGDAVNPPDTSIWYYNAGAHQSTTYITQTEILNALRTGLGLTFLELIDVDALMVQDATTVGRWDPGDEILFSVRPTAGLDGGEIFHYINGGGISYLFHGGVLWDTANPVATIFGSNSENIDGLEAVTIPEPGALSLLLLGLAGFFLRRRRHGLR